MTDGYWIRPAKPVAALYHFRAPDSLEYLCGMAARHQRRGTVDSLAPYDQKCTFCLMALLDRGNRESETLLWLHS